jgi:hypothetical protein
MSELREITEYPGSAKLILANFTLTVWKLILTVYFRPMEVPPDWSLGLNMQPLYSQLSQQ